MDGDALDWLQGWYESQATGGWEHRHGIRIRTLDNPGWSVSIDLRETGLQGRSFETVNHDRGERDWLYCWVEDDRFEGRCGPRQLREVLSAFRSWAAPDAVDG